MLYPVILVADANLEAFGVNTFLNDIFEDYAGEVAGELRPLTMMSIQELEEALAFISAGAFTWPELLDSRFEITSDARRVRLWSVHQAAHDLAVERNAPLGTTNEFRKRQFLQIGSQIVERFKAAKT